MSHKQSFGNPGNPDACYSKLPPGSKYHLEGFYFPDGELKDVTIRLLLERPGGPSDASDSPKAIITKRLVGLFGTCNFYASFRDHGGFTNILSDDLSWGNYRMVGVVVNYYVKAREAYCADENKPAMSVAATGLNRILCSLVDDFRFSRNKTHLPWTNSRKEYIARVRAVWREAMKKGFQAILDAPPSLPDPGPNPDWLRWTGPAPIEISSTNLPLTFAPFRPQAVTDHHRGSGPNATPEPQPDPADDYLYEEPEADDTESYEFRGRIKGRCSIPCSLFVTPEPQPKPADDHVHQEENISSIPYAFSVTDSDHRENDNITNSPVPRSPSSTSLTDAPNPAQRPVAPSPAVEAREKTPEYVYDEDWRLRKTMESMLWRSNGERAVMQYRLQLPERFIGDHQVFEYLLDMAYIRIRLYEDYLRMMAEEAQKEQPQDGQAREEGDVCDEEHEEREERE